MKFVVLFEDHPDASADVRRNHMSEHLAFLERNSRKVNAAGPLKTSSGQGAGGIWIVDHSLTTSVARAGIAPVVEPAITTNAAPKRSHPIDKRIEAAQERPRKCGWNAGSQSPHLRCGYWFQETWIQETRPPSRRSSDEEEQAHMTSYFPAQNSVFRDCP